MMTSPSLAHQCLKAALQDGVRELQGLHKESKSQADLKEDVRRHSQDPTQWTDKLRGCFAIRGATTIS